MTLHIHKNINKKIEFLLNSGKIPNIIFHGPHGGGKRTIVNEFIEKIYETDRKLLKAYVMNVNCAYGKGIKFIREEIKFFAQTHINFIGKGKFKTIILTNADNLTIDAQSALRRCIELFSHTTRFFIIVENRCKLLKPILSRFCEFFVPLPVYEGKQINLHEYSLQQMLTKESKISETSRKKWLQRFFTKLQVNNSSGLVETAITLYEKGYCGLDIMCYLENIVMEEEKKYHLLLLFHKVKREFLNEKLLILFMLNFILFRSDINLENMSFM